MFYVCIDQNRLANGYYLICFILFFGGEGVAGLPIDALGDEVFAGAAHCAAAQFSGIICD